MATDEVPSVPISEAGLEEHTARVRDSVPLDLSPATLDALAGLVAAKISSNPLIAPSSTPGATAVAEGTEIPIRVLPPTSGSSSTKSVPLSTLISDSTKESVGSKEVKPSEESGNDLTFISEGLPPVSTKIVQKIERGEYVDFRDLLSQKPTMDESALTELEDQGIIVVAASKQVKPKKKQIQDLATWMEAFLTFVAIRCKKVPEETRDLLAYGALIAKGARDYKGSGWLTYDFQFRRVAAARGKATQWAVKDVSLWNKTVAKHDWSATSHPSQTEEKKLSQKRRSDSGTGSSTQVAKNQKNAKNWKSSVCFPFSYTGKCNRENCGYLHVCFDCGEGHSQTTCPKNSST